MKQPMKRLFVALLVGSLSLTTSCQSFLDVNTNPNGPQSVTANLYLPPMIHWMVTSPQYDGRFIGRYTQQWMLPTTSATPSTWDRMGYDPSSDNGAQQWRDVYWSFGQNLVDMMNKAEAEQRWDLLGVGQILKAWGWQVLTDMHGEIIVQQAVDQSRFSFDYDTQEFAYGEVQRLLTEAIKNLQRTDGAVDKTYLAAGDKLYNGDASKWIKFAYGMLALNLNHYSNKSTYNPDSVIALVDKSFTGAADEPTFVYPSAGGNDDRNFWGPTRDNITPYRQTQFVVDLMNGTVFGTEDPRMRRMLAASPDGTYRGLDNNVGNSFAALDSTLRPNNFYGYVGAADQSKPGRYIFDNKAALPVMTYAELQFVKAEAAFKRGRKDIAVAAYRNGLTAHFAYVNDLIGKGGQVAAPISATDRDAFINSAGMGATEATLTLSHIMSQKYIALWGWGHNELWMDMRRYHYTDPDPDDAARQIYPGFTPPKTLYADNGGKVVQRIRPRYNSEYVWNVPALKAIGADAPDYHTKPMWITQP